MTKERKGGFYIKVIFCEVVVEVVDTEAGACGRSAEDVRNLAEIDGFLWEGLRFAFGRIAIDAGIATASIGSAGLKLLILSTTIGARIRTHIEVRLHICHESNHYGRVTQISNRMLEEVKL